METRNPKSTAQVLGHPIHPMLIPFPIAFFVAALGCDLAFWSSGNSEWAGRAMWLLGAGVLMGALAAIAGWTDFFGERRIRNLSAAWQHGIGNAAIILIQIVNFYLRYRDGAEVIVPAGLLLSAITVAALLFTGWRGWEMVYRHRVGISDEGSEMR
jgi:uncharacterized membrane protein